MTNIVQIYSEFMDHPLTFPGLGNTKGSYMSSYVRYKIINELGWITNSRKEFEPILCGLGWHTMSKARVVPRIHYHNLVNRYVLF